MVTTPRIGVVGAGTRAAVHLTECYRIRDRTYLYNDTDHGNPEAVYREHAASMPEWAIPVDDLEPGITAIFDPSDANREEAASFCREHGDDPETFETLDAFLAADAYDAVVIASPTAAHEDAAVPLLAEDVDVLLEKPVAPTLAGHDRIIEAAERSSAVTFVAYNLRCSPFYRRLKALVDDGVVGELGMIGCQEVRTPFGGGFRYSQERSGGAILEKNCHDFDVYAWLAEADPIRVAAFGGQHVYTENSEIVDHANVIVEFENGVRGTLDLCLYAPFGERIRKYDLRGSDGLLRAPEKRGTVEHFARERRDTYRIPERVREGGHSGADIVQFHRFLRCLEGEAEPPASLADAKRAGAISIAAQRSIDDGRIVGIDDDYDLEIGGR